MPKVIQKTLFNDTKALRLTLFLCMGMYRQEGRERDLQMGWAISIKKKTTYLCLHQELYLNIYFMTNCL